MSKTKPVAKKQKESSTKKVAARNTSAAKPIKLGGVPTQGSLS